MTADIFRLTKKQDEANKLLGGVQRSTLLVGGARSGKTFLLTRAIIIRALRAPMSRHVIFRYRANAVWTSIGLDTLPKVMRLCFPGVPCALHSQDRYFSFQNGSQIWLGGLDEPARVEKILGLEFATLYLNEASQIPYASYVVARTRLAQVCEGIVQRELIDLNPCGKGHWTYRIFVEGVFPDSRKPVDDPAAYQSLYMNPIDNLENLSTEYLHSLETLPEKQRKRFLEGLYIDEVDGALWTLESIDNNRVDEINEENHLQRVVIAVDPSGCSGDEDKRSDEIGIIVAALGTDGDAYILEDYSGRMAPEQWGAVVVNAWQKHQADAVAVENNYGGAMVKSTIETQANSRKIYGVKVVEVHGSRGKHVRAEPISALYSVGKVHHVGRFPELEDQMVAFSSAGYMGSRSPDRADALVWALTDLLVDQQDQAGIWAQVGLRLGG